jgi:hypothetical protein
VRQISITQGEPLFRGDRRGNRNRVTQDGTLMWAVKMERRDCGTRVRVRWIERGRERERMRVKGVASWSQLDAG